MGLGDEVTGYDVEIRGWRGKWGYGALACASAFALLCPLTHQEGVRVTRTGGLPSLIWYDLLLRLAAPLTSQANSLGSTCTCAVNVTPSLSRQSPRGRFSGIPETGRRAFNSGDQGGGDEGAGLESDGDGHQAEENPVADDGHAKFGGVFGEGHERGDGCGGG